MVYNQAFGLNRLRKKPIRDGFMIFQKHLNGECVVISMELSHESWSMINATPEACMHACMCSSSCVIFSISNALLNHVSDCSSRWIARMASALAFSIFFFLCFGEEATSFAIEIAVLYPYLLGQILCSFLFSRSSAMLCKQ